MDTAARLRLLFFFWLALLSAALSTTVQGGDVTYDRRSLIIDGQHKILFSGSIHYPRSTPDTWALSSETLYEKVNLPTNSNGATYYVKMWPSLISKAKEGGLDVIQTYAFWNLHEPQQGQYDFSGRADIVRFMKEIQAQGLYACLRIGPFIEAEWSYGGFPFWLHDIPGIVFRSDNEQFKYQMQRFVTKIVSLMKSENLNAPQGGPIILSQIENEYQMVEAAFHEKGPRYVRWAAAMAVGLQTGVPWVMSKQDDAPDPVINACNGMGCGETFAGPNSPNKPSIWTENWTSWYQVYGGEPYIRSAQDIAFQVALFIAKNGSYVNYYMYHGGTNFGRAASAFVTTSYYDEAPLDEYGLTKQPKWGHLKELHATIKSCSNALLHGLQNKNPLGEMQDAYVFKGNSGECTAFLVNNDKKRDVKVLFQNVEYELPQHSISILPDCKTMAFNTARITAPYTTRSTALRQKYNSIKKWRQYQEGAVEFEKTTLRAKMLLDHMSATKDRSDYLWYTFRFQHNSSNVQAVLNALSHGHILHAYVNGIYVGTAHGSHQNTSFTFEKTIDLRNGTNNISLLSVMVGLPDSGAYLERKVAGLRRVRIQNKDFTDIAWGYQVGLLGEELQIYTHSGANKVQWNKLGSTADQRLTWYKTVIDAPGGNDPVALNLGSMGKGQAWINGQSIGRYWTSFHTSKGTPSQIRYHVPRSFLKPKGNLLVLLEEENGYPAGITMDTISIAKVCINVAESNASAIKLSCPQRRNITRILFASFGTTSGNCESYAIGNCHSSNSRAKIEKTCTGKNNCSIIQSSQFFGGDPCPGIPKSLLVDVKCT